MMKKILIPILLFFVLFSCKESQEDKGFLIQGYITGYFEGKVVLAKYLNGKIINIDSVFMTKSKFKFKDVKIDSPELYYLIIDNGEIIIEFFADCNHMQINADYNKKSELEVQGSKAHGEYVSFLENNVVYENKQKEIYKQKDIALENHDVDMLSELDSMYTANFDEQLNYIYSYVVENNNSFVSVFIALQSMADYASLDQLEEIALNFNDSVKGSTYYKELNNKINIIKKTSEGKQAPDFSLPDTSGNSVSLSSLQGKYILLDFAATWHGPSRSRNPKLNKVYESYNKKGFEVFQVSSERSKDEWKKIIEADQIKWIIVSDVKGLDSEILSLYGIRSLPKNFLLDKEGMIIAKDLSPDDLENILKELL